MVPAVSGVLANDTDPDGNPLTAVLVSDVTNGALTLNSDGSFTYIPDDNFNGTDSFMYLATDGDVTTGLVGHWRFEDNLLDSSGLGNHGTAQGTGVTFAAGFSGQAAQFDGAGRVEVAHSASLNLSNAITLASWIQPTAIPPGNNSGVLFKGALDGSQGAYDLVIIDNNGTIGARANINDATTSAFVNSGIALGAWQHLAATYDGTTLRLYINGVQVAATPFVGSIAQEVSPLNLGARFTTNPFQGRMQGLIDEARVYDRALSAQEIAALAGIGGTNIATVTIEVTPVVENTITLTPDPLNLLTSAVGTLTITLANPAGSGGHVVNLMSSNSAVASVPPSATVPENATSVMVDVTTGTTAGSAIITASAPDVTGDTSTVNVASRTMTLALDSPLVGVGRTINGTITLPQPAPMGGVTVMLASQNAGIATVAPASVPIAGGGTTGSFTVTGVMQGTTTLMANATGFDQATQNIEVTASVIVLGTGLVVAPSQSSSLPVSLTTPAPTGGVTINFTSSNPAIATITPSVFVPQGLQTPAANPQVTGVNIGTVQITATATGFAPDTRDVVVTLTLVFVPGTVSVVANGGTTNVTLNLSAPAPPGGLPVNLSTDNPATATVPANITVGQGQLSAQVTVTGVAVGNTTLRANVTGVNEATATVNVTPPPNITFNLASALVGEDLQQSVNISLQSAPPAHGHGHRRRQRHRDPHHQRRGGRR